MEAVVKVYGGILVLMLNLYAGITLSVATQKVSVAENYRAVVTAEIENSNFNSNVIDACIAEAEQMGYGLQINDCVYDEDHDIQSAEVVLVYNYQMPLFGIDEQRVSRGIAR